MYKAEESVKNKVLIWYSGPNAKKYQLCFVLNLVVGMSDLQIQSKQCNACQGLELVKNSVCTFCLRVCGKHLPFSFKYTASQLVEMVSECRKVPFFIYL